MKKIILFSALQIALAQQAFAGHHPPIESDDNSGTAFLISIGGIALIALLVYFIQRKSKK